LKVHDWNFGPRAPFAKTVAKAEALWNCLNLSSEAANQIREVVGNKLKRPEGSCWNSFYDSCVVLLELLEHPVKKDALNLVLCRQSLSPFCDNDRDLLAQYCKIMEPVAECLGILQSEENAFMGILLPNLRLMQEQLTNLRTDTSIKEGQALVNYLLENPHDANIAFSGRFEHMFQDEDLLMATALHPHFKLCIVGHISPGLKEVIRERVINEVMTQVDPVVDAVEVKHLLTQDDPDPFKHMRGGAIEVGAQDSLKKEVEGTYASWDRVSVNSHNSLSCDHFPFQQRSAWLYIFSKYNTPLPSSAAGERLVSFGSDILRAKRSSIAADNFEKLVFLKGNMHLMK
jgi:hypothetical protein